MNIWCLNKLTAFLKKRYNKDKEKNLIFSMFLLRFASLEFEREYAVLRSGNPENWKGKSIYFSENIRWNRLGQRNQKALREGLYEALCIMDKEGSKYKGLVHPKDVFGSFDDRELYEVFHIIGELSFDKDGEEHSDFLQFYEFIIRYLVDWSTRQIGSYYTPRQIACLMVELLEPGEGVIYDPCCGSGSMLLYASDYMRRKKQSYKLYGQEADKTAWKIARINLLLRGIDADLGKTAADTLQNDLHTDLKADIILANPPFQRYGKRQEQRFNGIQWKTDFPPAAKGDFAWMQHMLSRLKKQGRMASIFSNGILASQRREERDIRAALLREDVVEAIFTLPPGMFYATKVPVSLWILRINKEEICKKKILFVDARKMGSPEDGLTRLSDLEQERLIEAYKNYQNGVQDEQPGFCRQVSIKEIDTEEYSLAPERYIVDKRQKQLNLEEIEDRQKELEKQLEKLLKENEVTLGQIS